MKLLLLRASSKPADVARPLIAAAVLLAAAGCTSASAPVSVASSSSSTTTVARTTIAPTTIGGAPTTTTLAPGESPPTTLPFVDTALRLEPVADGFEQPVFATEENGRFYVVDQPGVIWSIVADEALSAFLDIRDRVKFGGEQGLLSMAFHPEYPDLVYVDYTAKDNATTISEFTIDTGNGVADPESERIILEIDQPANNHNGGMIAFGPAGALWIGMGDGGGANDQFGNGQREDTLLGAMLRIEVGPGIATYEPPEDHDFAAPEIWAIGLRNPWRFSFDGEMLWIADVGQGDVEEINFESTEVGGRNFGWPLYEGTDCFSGPCDGIDASLRVLSEPVYEYRHDEGCSVTGGYVYRGSEIPQLDGHYFFSDWCSGFIRSIARDGTVYDWTEGTGTVDQVTSFGRDGSGEIYVVSGAGTVYRIVEDEQ